MENVSMIAAIGRNNELGKNNCLIWHLPGDLKFFKDVTMGKDIKWGVILFIHYLRCFLVENILF